MPSRFFRDVLFILPKSDLPVLKYNALNEETIGALELDLIDEEKMLYASVIDLTQEKNVAHREQWNNNAQDNPQQSVQLTLAFATELIWKVKKDVVQLNMVSPFQEQGIKDEITDIEPFKDVAND